MAYVENGAGRIIDSFSHSGETTPGILLSDLDTSLPRDLK